MVLNAFIVDDEQQTRNALQTLLEEFCPDVTIRGTAGDLGEALAAIPRHDIDILFLDINLGGHTGFDLLDRIGPHHFDIVFVTAYEAYALKAFEYAAVHYLLKPVSHHTLRDTVARVRKRKEAVPSADLQQLSDKLLQALSPASPRIALSDMHKTEFVYLDDIAYLESNGSYTVFYLKDNRNFVKSRNLKYFEDAFMAHPRFVRVHKSYVVNRDQVRAYRKQSQELELFGGAVIPVSIGYRLLLEHLGHALIL